MAALADCYAVEHEVGLGAMATVYRTHDLHLDHYIPVKVLNSDLSAAVGMRDPFLMPMVRRLEASPEEGQVCTEHLKKRKGGT